MAKCIQLRRLKMVHFSPKNGKSRVCQFQMCYLHITHLKSFYDEFGVGFFFFFFFFSAMSTVHYYEDQVDQNKSNTIKHRAW